MARLWDEHPDVFEEYLTLFEPKIKTFSQRWAENRRNRMSRIFGGR